MRQIKCRQCVVVVVTPIETEKLLARLDSHVLNVATYLVPNYVSKLRTFPPNEH